MVNKGTIVLEKLDTLNYIHQDLQKRGWNRVSENKFEDDFGPSDRRTINILEDKQLGMICELYELGKLVAVNSYAKLCKNHLV